MAKHRIGIVGCGGIAHRHIEGYRLVAGELGDVVAGCDPNPLTLESYCTKYDLPYRFTDPIDLIKSGVVDVISLLTPPAVRGEVIFPAIEYGIHLLVEKPFGENLMDAISFVDAAENAGTFLAVNQQLRFMPDIKAIREILASGEMGEPRFIAHDQFQNRTSATGWRKDEERLEISIFSIHLLDRVRWLMGKRPEAVTAATRYWCEDVRGETFTALTIQFEGGSIGTMVSNWHSLNIPECRLRIDCEKGSLLSQKKSVLADEATLTAQPLGKEAQKQDFSNQNSFTIAMGESMNGLLIAIDTGVAPINSGKDNLETMAIVDAAYLSASRGGERVDIDRLFNGNG